MNFKINPFSGKPDMIDGNGGMSDADLADWVANTSTPVWPSGVSTEGLTAMQILKKMLCKDVMPMASIACSPAAGLYESGQTLTVNVAATPTKGTYDLSSMTLVVKRGNAIVDQIPATSVATGVEYDFGTISIAVNTDLYVQVKDAQGNVGNSPVQKYTFGLYRYCAFVFDPVELDDINQGWLDQYMPGNARQLVTGRAMSNTTFTPAVPESYFYIILPLSFNCAVEHIFDMNANTYGFMKCLGDTVITTATGASVAYRVFKSNRAQLGAIKIQIK